MREHPIIFSTPMVQAILEGKKTQTRRIIKPQPIDNTEVDGNFFEGNHKGYVKVDNHPNWKEQFVFEFSKKQIGDLLWVRETVGIAGSRIFYKADNNDYENAGLMGFYDFKWKPSIHMPRIAARIILEIVNIRIERVNDISEADAKAEGVIPFKKNYDDTDDCWTDDKYKTAYEFLWNEINGWNPNSWEQNQWTWVYNFKNITK